MRAASKNSPVELLHGELKTLFDGGVRERESKFKSSRRWGYLKSELLKAAKRGKREIIVKNAYKDFGKAKDYAEWEVRQFIDEYDLVYCYVNDKEDYWRIYWRFEYEI